MELLNSSVNTLYLISFVTGASSYKEAILFMESSFDKKIKQSNMSKIISKLIDSKYIIQTNNSSCTRYAQKKLSVNKRKIIEDILKILSEVTSKFRYTYRLNGKRITSRKRFSYDEMCKQFGEDIQNNNFLVEVFSVFNIYCMNIIRSKKSSDLITRKTYDFAYTELIEDFIIGMSISNTFFKEYTSYISEDELLAKTLYKDFDKSYEKEFNNFINICKNYLIIKNIKKHNLIAKASFRHLN